MSSSLREAQVAAFDALGGDDLAIQVVASDLQGIMQSLLRFGPSNETVPNEPQNTTQNLLELESARVLAHNSKALGHVAIRLQQEAADIQNALQTKLGLESEVCKFRGATVTEQTSNEKGHIFWPMIAATTSLSNEQASPLRHWTITHLDDPYPSSHDRNQLVHLTGIPIARINHWFTNHRRRSGYTEHLKTLFQGDKRAFRDAIRRVMRGERGEDSEEVVGAVTGMVAYYEERKRVSKMAVGEWINEVIAEPTSPEPAPKKTRRSTFRKSSAKSTASSNSSVSAASDAVPTLPPTLLTPPSSVSSRAPGLGHTVRTASGSSFTTDPDGHSLSPCDTSSTVSPPPTFTAYRVPSQQFDVPAYAYSPPNQPPAIMPPYDPNQPFVFGSSPHTTFQPRLPVLPHHSVGGWRSSSGGAGGDGYLGSTARKAKREGKRKAEEFWEAERGARFGDAAGAKRIRWQEGFDGEEEEDEVDVGF